MAIARSAQSKTPSTNSPWALRARYENWGIGRETSSKSEMRKWAANSQNIGQLDSCCLMSARFEGAAEFGCSRIQRACCLDIQFGCSALPFQRSSVYRFFHRPVVRPLSQGRELEFLWHK